jgi:hypothetical protein
MRWARSSFAKTCLLLAGTLFFLGAFFFALTAIPKSSLWHFENLQRLNTHFQPLPNGIVAAVIIFPDAWYAVSRESRPARRSRSDENVKCLSLSRLCAEGN